MDFSFYRKEIMIIVLFVYAKCLFNLFFLSRQQEIQQTIKNNSIYFRGLYEDHPVYTEMALKETAKQMNILSMFCFLSFKRHAEQTHKITTTMMMFSWFSSFAFRTRENEK